MRSVSILIIGLIVLSVSVASASASALDSHAEECYAVSMVGYDSVINASLGVPLDEVINTFLENNTEVQSLEIYQNFLLLVVMDAYQWGGTPHMYAASTMYQCASKHSEVAMH